MSTPMERKPARQAQRLPVTVLAGALGAGKTAWRAAEGPFPTWGEMEEAA